MWTCFHCGETFTDVAAATEHFGFDECSSAACQIDVKAFREMEELLSRYRAEDSDLERELYKMTSDHDIAVRRAEETGYARGLRDGRGDRNQVF